MRLFVAIRIAEDLSDQIKRTQIELKKLDAVIGNYIPKINFHVTLKFLGEVDDEVVPEIIEALDQIRYPAMNLEIAGLETLPLKSENIRNICLRVAGEQLEGLAQEIDDRLENFAGDREYHFVPHITLVRVKTIKKRAQFLDALKHIETPQQKFHVSEVSLMRSKLGPGIPEYKELARFGLLP